MYRITFSMWKCQFIRPTHVVKQGVTVADSSKVYDGDIEM